MNFHFRTQNGSSNYNRGPRFISSCLWNHYQWMQNANSYMLKVGRQDWSTDSLIRRKIIILQKFEKHDFICPYNLPLLSCLYPGGNQKSTKNLVNRDISNSEENWTLVRIT